MKAIRKEKINMATSFLGLLLICLISVSACTKKIPFEGLPAEEKEKDISKSLLDTKSEYLYSASQQNASRSAADAFPFQSGDNKRVKLEITKESLRIVEVERDQRFASNSMNNKVVLEIPVEHVQYGCKKDRFGECTNTEEKNTELSWDQKDTLKIKLEEIKSGEVELLPILSSAAFGENCYENVSSRLISSIIEENAINFQIERVFKTQLGCLSDDATSLSDATVSAVYHYSIIKASSVLSKDYQTVSYPEGSKDEQTFGFFSSQRTQLDVDNNNSTKSTVQIMNRWNPNRSEIVYHLSDEFAKPENKILKDLTFATVENLNQGLQEAGVKFRINLKDGQGKVPGDIRNSMIILVEDPVAASVIGYGPQTEDPVTGEIISARTVMFLGTIKKYAKYTYDEIVREKKNQRRVLEKSGFQLSKSLVSQVEGLKKTGKVFGASEMMDDILAKIAKSPVKAEEKTEDAGKKASSVFKASISLGKPQIQKAVASLRNYTALKNDNYSGRDLKSKIRYLQEVKNCAFAPAMEMAAGSISAKLLAQFPEELKPWSELSDSEKESALTIILPEIWVPTLIHELGHNLGLRHNFAASEDKANFYSDQHLAEKGVDHSVPFSSVMDYGNDLKTLPMLGKYDIAALRFGYLRKVTTITADKESIVDVPSTLEELFANSEKESLTLKEFAFCTDEHTGINAGCKRFDLGTSYTEIVQNLIQDYENAYSKRNLRDGRASFSQMTDLAYLSRVSGIFREFRVMMEVVERIKYKFKVADDAPEWESIPFLKDLKQATLLGGSFMANVLLVPDVHCAVALTAKPNEIIAVVPAAQIDPEAMSCQSLSLKPEFKVVGQAGKALNSKKDPNSRNPYVDQIDVRGIWLDKVAAMQTLTARTIDIPTMNGNTDSFLNVPELRKGIIDVVQGLILNNVVNKVEFTMLDGSKQNFEIQYDMNESQLIEHPLIVDVIERASISEDQKKRIMNRLGVRMVGTTPLKQIIAKTLAVNAIDPNRVHTADDTLRDAVSVYKFDSVTSVPIDKSKKRMIFNKVQYVADSQNLFGIKAMELLPLVQLMAKVDEAGLAQLLELKAKKEKFPEDPPGSSEEAKAKRLKMKAVFENVEAEKIEDFLNGLIKNEKFYQELLQVLPSAN